MSFQDVILALQVFWSRQGCVILQPYDMEMGAGTSHPATALETLSSRDWNVAFVQPSRRPQDGRYGDNPNRFQKYYQFQVILKPSPENAQELLLKSFDALGLAVADHDIRFVEDDWENPSLGASGLGWEVWYDGMEVVQMTYFQQIGGIACSPVAVEMTYGLERIAMGAQKVSSAFDLAWNDPGRSGSRTWRDLCWQAEREFSIWYFDEAPVTDLLEDFEKITRHCDLALSKELVLPAYEMCIRAGHTFNMLDARGAVSIAQRAQYIQRIRGLACRCCEMWVEQQKKGGAQ